APAAALCRATPLARGRARPRLHAALHLQAHEATTTTRDTARSSGACSTAVRAKRAARTVDRTRTARAPGQPGTLDRNAHAPRRRRPRRARSASVMLTMP